MTRIDTSLTRLLGMRLPLIVAPMFLISNVEMVLAATAAGATAVIPSLNYRTTAAFREALAQLTEQAQGPFGVNLILLDNPRLADDLAACIEFGVPYLVTSLGNPTEVIAQAHAYGMKVLCDVVNLRHARKAVAAGADALVTVASGAGGHAGPISPMVLVPWLQRHLPVPIVAAGGLADGAGLASVLALGAGGAYMGTRFIAASEAPAPDEFKTMILAADPEMIETSAEVTGHPANFLKASLERFRQLPGQKAWKDAWSAGHSVALIDGIEPVGEIIARIVSEYEAARKALPPLVTDA
jgi:nitronate monooxygenase